MKTHKLFILLCLLTLTVSTVVAQKTMTLQELRNMGKKKTEVKAVKKEKPEVMEDKSSTDEDDKGVEAPSLVENSNAEVPSPFIYIVRTKGDLENLKPLIGELYLKKEIDFTKQAIVAAFAGMKNSGGYSVSVKKATDGIINVDVNSPESGSMTTQAITYPHKIALIDIQEEDSLNINASDEFTKAMTSYKVTSSEFKVTGGFIGREVEYEAEGTIGVMKFGKLVTFAFNLKGSEESSSNFVLNEMASGKMSGSKTNLARVEAGNFMARPHPPLDISVKIIENKLSMMFEPGKRNYVVNDGYVGRGSLEAVLQK